MGRLCGVIFLARDEFARLYTVANDTLKPILVLAVETGMRKEELLSLRHEQIDLRRREVHLEATKTSSPCRVLLSVTAVDTIRDLLERRSRPTSPFLFCKPNGSRIGDPKKGFIAACVRAGLSDSATTISATPSRVGSSRKVATSTDAAASSATPRSR